MRVMTSGIHCAPDLCAAEGHTSGLIRNQETQPGYRAFVASLGEELLAMGPTVRACGTTRLGPGSHGISCGGRERVSALPAPRPVLIVFY